MIGKSVESPHLNSPIGIDGKTPLPTRPTRSTRRRLNQSQRRMFPETVRQVEPAIKPISPEIAAFFKGRDLPTDVWAPPGVVYYEKFDDIPTIDAPPEPGTHSKYVSLEERADVALQVCPPAKEEPADASFKFVGERGLYVRVILDKVEEKVGEVVRKKPVIRWMRFNEEAAEFKDIRYR